MHAHFRHDPAPQESCIQESAILPNVKTGIEANGAGILFVRDHLCAHTTSSITVATCCPSLYGDPSSFDGAEL